MEEVVTEVYGTNRSIHRSSSVLSNSGVPHKKWTLNTQERNSNMMDEERTKFKIYEYLCHVGETKEWMERLLKKELAPISGFENQLQYGITLAELAKLFSPESVKKIFENEKLQFRHSDNINYFFDALNNISFPQIFYFELTDCYEKKNMPKVIYCLHALSHVLEFKGYGKAVRNLVGKLEFTDNEVEAQMEVFKDNNINLPKFSNLENTLQEEIKKSTTNISFDEKNIYNESPLEEFVPSSSFYRKGEKTDTLQRRMFKNHLYNELEEEGESLLKDNEEESLLDKKEEKEKETVKETVADKTQTEKNEKDVKKILRDGSTLLLFIILAIAIIHSISSNDKKK